MPSAAVLAGIVAQVISYAFLVLRMQHNGLLRVYHVLAVYALADAVRLLISLGFKRGTNAYGWYYFTTQAAMWLLLAWLVLEVYGNVFRGHAGLARFSRRAISMVLAGSVLIAVSTLWLRATADTRWPVLEGFFLFERTIFVSLFAFVLILGVFLAWYPVRLPRNALTHFSVFTFYFACSATAMLLRTMGGSNWAGMANLLLVLGTITSATAWGALLHRSGESILTRAGYRRSHADEERLLQKLEDLNRSLLGTKSRR